MSDTALACRLIDTELQQRKQLLSDQFFSAVTTMIELKDGFGFQLPEGAEWPAKALEVIHLEQQCCPFFVFELVFSADNGPRWLHIRGATGVKEFIQTELGDQIAHLR